jgi:hypothetical protein
LRRSIAVKNENQNRTNESVSPFSTTALADVRTSSMGTENLGTNKLSSRRVRKGVGCMVTEAMLFSCSYFDTEELCGDRLISSPCLRCRSPNCIQVFVETASLHETLL